MLKIKVGYIALPMVSFLAIILLISLTEPNPNNITLIIALLFLIYLFSVSVVYLFLKIISYGDSSSKVQLALLAGCLLPAVIVFSALRQASFFDIALIIVTLAVLIWYVINRK